MERVLVMHPSELLPCQTGSPPEAQEKDQESRRPRRLGGQLTAGTRDGLAQRLTRRLLCNPRLPALRLGCREHLVKGALVVGGPHTLRFGGEQGDNSGAQGPSTSRGAKSRQPE